ncbi:CDP-glycerol glycerophosphotransferase family protein, partial [Methanobrevibacter sp. OttesenSCG-928-I08]|nr:CDP-glycerol glycerophosphotransferase family protein [Methanobrevibacter sp. OttesenSCG-928-I08]
YKEYLKLFKLKQPKQIFVVVAYENNAVVKAAKDLNIEVIEIQHGTISKYHLGYSYPNKTRCFNGKLEEIAYFPDKLLSFGDYWNNSSYFPISREHIISIGFPYFESNTKNYMGVNKESNKILFISQGVIGKYLSKFAFELGEKLSSYEIIYKLHPGEYSSWRENYKYLLDASKLDNFKVIDNNNTPLYQLFAESNYQIGVFSTAIYEGLSFNCKTFVLDFPGVEYLDDLVDDGFICKINSVNELIQNIETFAPKNYNKDFFFKKYDENVLKNIIK